MFGCATSTYHFEISPRVDNLSTELTTGREIVVSPFETRMEKDGFESQGFGGQVSLVETTEYTFARIGYFYTSFEEESFVRYPDGVTPTSSNIKIDAQGMELAIGLNIWYFRPYLSSNYINYKVAFGSDQSDLNDFSGSSGILGYGLAADIPLSEKTHLLINSHQRDDTLSFSLGLMFRLGVINSGTKK